jgi:glycosyltransferase involved in cell wall biosynthesis
MSDLKRFPLVLNKYLYPFMAFGAAMILHRRKPYDAVMSVMTSYASFATLFFKWLHPRVPYLLRADDGDPFDHYRRKSILVAPLFKRLFTDADRAVVTSSYLAHMIEKEGFSKEATIVPNGVNAKHFAQEYTPDAVEKAKARFGKRPGDIFLVTTSRLVKKNAVDDVIRALRFLPDNVRFLVFGLGPDETALLRLAETEGVTARVDFLGQADHKDLPLFLHACDIFIRPSLSEGFGISFIEAMVAGIPVIATQEGGIADFLYDPEVNPDKEPTGLAVLPGDPEAIAGQVTRYMTDTPLRTQIVRNAKKMAMERYDWGIIAQKMESHVLDKLFSNSPV